MKYLEPEMEIVKLVKDAVIVTSDGTLKSSGTNTEDTEKNDFVW